MSAPYAAIASSPHLLIPFAGPAGLACRAALPELQLPHLQALLARLTRASEDRQDESSLSPPHERAWAQALGLSTEDGLIPWAALHAAEQGLPGADSQAWGLLTLCHWQVGMSEVVLNEPQQLGVSREESEALLAIARPFFEDDALTLFATPQPGQWLVCGAMLDGLPTASLDRAVGQVLSSWLPMGDAARALRRLQNEMQMLLYTTPLNDARSARGQLPINSFWLSGTGAAPKQPLSAAPKLIDTLRDSALQDDGSGWSRAWQALDAEVLGPLHQQARAGQPLTLTLCGHRSALRLENRPLGLSGWVRSRLRQPSVVPVLEAL